MTDKISPDILDTLIRENVELRELVATLGNRIARFEACPFLMEHVLHVERQAAGTELAIVADVQRDAARAAVEAGLLADVNKRPWGAIRIPLSQPRGTTRVFVDLGKLGQRDAAPGGIVHREYADELQTRLASDPALAAAVADGEVEIVALSTDEAIRNELSRRQRETVAAKHNRAPIDHHAARKRVSP